MNEIDSRYIAFENDHTYLKTTYGSRDVQLIPTSISTVGSNNDGIVFSTTSSSTKCQSINCKNETIQNSDSTLNLQPNSNLYFLSNPLNFPLSSNINILQNSLPIQKVNIENHFTTRPIQSKIGNATNIVSILPTQSNVLFCPTTNVPLTQQSQNMAQKKIPTKPLLPVASQDKFVIKPIKPMKNKIVKDYENGIYTIKLSSNLLQRIQSGEKLFMCMECDKIYTRHKDLLDHQMIHDKCDKNIISQEQEKRENILVNNNIDIKVEKNKNKTNVDNIIKQSKPILKSSGNSKKQKVIFQGECIMCHSVFPDLETHLRMVHRHNLNKNKVNNLKYHCYKCDVEFDIKQQLLAHESSAHKPTNAFICEHCHKNFTHKEDLESHIEIHFGDSMKYLCPYCDAGFPHSNGLRIHLSKHIGFNSSENSSFELSASQVDYSPTRPPEQLDQLFEELNNITDNGDEIYVEEVADDDFQVKFTKDECRISVIPVDPFVDNDPAVDIDINKVKLKDNDKITINQQQTTSLNKNRISYTVCRLCMVIVSYSRIGRHMKKKHNNAAPYQCEICHAEFNRKHIMDDHRRKHTNNKPHKCIECFKCFTYKHHLNRHMMIVHNADSLEKPFKCSVCDKAFSFKEYLTLHVNSRHKGKHYMCQICGKNFSTNAALNKHQLCHTDERPFMCEHCGRTFKCKTHCDTHKKNMHPGDPQLAFPPEKFECDLCNKKFSTKVYRDMHYKRHNGQGHQCDICYKLFVSKAHMQRHLKIMHQN